MLAVIAISALYFVVSAALGYFPNFYFWSSSSATRTDGDFGSPRGSIILIGLVPLAVLYFNAYLGVHILPKDAVLPSLICGALAGVIGGIFGMFQGISAFVAKREAFEKKKQDDEGNGEGK